MKMPRKYLILILVLSLVMTVVGCNKDSNNNGSKFTFNVNDKIRENINNEFRRKMGYGPSAEEIGTKADIYTTYYCIEMLEILGSPLNNSEINEFLRYYEENKDYYFFDENGNDSLLNIYYFTLIAELTEYDPTITEEIYEYICYIQHKEGDFELSKREMYNSIDEERHPELNLHSTRMAVEALSALDLDIPNLGAVKEWLEERFENFDSEIGERSISNILILRDIAESIGYDYSKYNELIYRIKEEYKEKILNKRNVDAVSLYNLFYEFRDTSIQNNEDIKNRIESQLLSLQDDSNGSFKLFADEPGTNILPTYYSLVILNDLGVEIFDSANKNVETWIMTFKTRRGGFILTGDLPNTLDSTFYAYTMGLMTDEDINKYLKIFYTELDKCTIEELYFITVISEETGLSVDMTEIEKFAKEKLEEDDIENLPYIIEVFYALKIIDSKNITSNVVEDISFSYDDYSIINVYNQIMLALLREEADMDLPDEQITFFKGLFNNLDSKYENYPLDEYCMVYKILDDNASLTDEIAKTMTEILDECETKSEGLYRNGTSDKASKSLRSSYLALLTRSNI